MTVALDVILFSIGNRSEWIIVSVQKIKLKNFDGNQSYINLLRVKMVLCASVWVPVKRDRDRLCEYTHMYQPTD